MKGFLDKLCENSVEGLGLIKFFLCYVIEYEFLKLFMNVEVSSFSGFIDVSIIIVL